MRHTLQVAPGVVQKQHDKWVFEACPQAPSVPSWPRQPREGMGPRVCIAANVSDMCESPPAAGPAGRLAQLGLPPRRRCTSDNRAARRKPCRSGWRAARCRQLRAGSVMPGHGRPLHVQATRRSTSVGKVSADAMESGGRVRLRNPDCPARSLSKPISARGCLSNPFCLAEGV